ncbi:MAG: hypothetical protein AAB348_01425 [Patescibacteria group bacterium]
MDPFVVELPFGNALDWTFWVNLFSLPSNELVKALFAIGGWAIIALIFFFMGAEMWIEVRRAKHTANWKWVLLAVDVPPEQIQSPKAVEQIFAQLSGALLTPNFGQKYWYGWKQKWFSLEIISIEGYIQFLIYTEAQFRDLVEAAVYAQYPMAEITEVEDYTSVLSSSFPNKDHDIVGLEFGLSAPDAYPVRTYEEFEHSVTKDYQFNDPMAAILENFARIGAGENLWLHIIIEPTGDGWKQVGIDLVKGIVAQKKSVAKQFFLFKFLSVLFTEILTAINPPATPAKPEKKKEETPGKISDLTPGMKDTVSAVEDKISKVGFKSKVRVLYVARQEVFNPSKCMEGFVGSMNQFNYGGRNSLTVKLGTFASYAFKNYRIGYLKQKFATAFKKRKIKIGKNPYILNIEELATIWHFPMPLVKTPLLQKTASKRAEPPINLPVEAIESPLKKIGVKEEQTPAKPEQPPEVMYG